MGYGDISRAIYDRGPRLHYLYIDIQPFGHLRTLEYGVIGNTQDFESWVLGSSPSIPTLIK